MVESKQLGLNRVSLRGMYVWGVDSTVTKHSDKFVWKDTSAWERVAWRYDDTVDKKRVNSCVLKQCFWRKLNIQKFTKNPRKCFLWRATNVTFSKFPAADAAQKTTVLRAVWIDFEFELIRGQRFWEVVVFTAQCARSFVCGDVSVEWCAAKTLWWPKGK